MKKEIIVTAKTVEEAKQKAVAELGIPAEEIEFTVLEEGKRGFLGIGAVDAKISASYTAGGADIALATSKLMQEFDAAVWAHHGLFVSGPDFDTAFGLMHTIEKAAQIWVLQKSTGLPELQTIQDDELRAIARDFKVQLREDFLD